MERVSTTAPGRDNGHFLLPCNRYPRDMAIPRRQAPQVQA
ncbi:hypothetical protein SAMN02745674_00338 [Lysobacter spongiicola DSM 21749]|uniref:Uncharacterized protein n=1 Tax=Lysobacter spongiicola DSM 21749 TaxID=1122188 RepID=A0A1T4M9W3_9GAMM|nr:hypothetical protein SAMN02745674_00338 [Lysobacter spongiicola DSM 21749]